MKKILLLLVAFATMWCTSCSNSKSRVIDCTNSSIYITCDTETNLDNVTYKSFQHPKISSRRINSLIYNEYTSSKHKAENGTRKLYIKWSKRTDKYGNSKEMQDYLCTIDIDEVRKYKSLDDYDHFENTVSKAYINYYMKFSKQFDDFE